ncbi:NAD(P)-dependent dehydrogenase, short-chain alcohol dehydrogenase family [Rhizobiales bacterium GAS113]|nr:NAD(P)-dependent dehydrogenase, short-chain alcohol dehydrogenase family [Rhizobiales bacterium GAS113]
MTDFGQGSAKSALVTGGARRIGRAIVESLAKAGYGVAIHCLGSQREAQILAAGIVAAGGRAQVIGANLAAPAEVARIVPEAVSALGPLSLLVNNASVFEEDDITTLEPGRFDRHMAINLRAPLLLARDFARQVKSAQQANSAQQGMPASHPAIINIVDQRVLKTDPRCFSYALAKSALWSATRSMAQALAPAIRVNAVAPGPTFPNPRDGEAGLRREAAATLLGLQVAPEAIAAAVLYLAEAWHVTGQTLAVDSGQHLNWLTPDVTATLR